MTSHSDLRKAAEMALEALDYHFDNQDNYWPYVLEAKQALRQALAQPEQRGHCTCGDPTLLGYVHFRTRPCIYYTAPPSIEAAVLAEREAIIEICNRHNHPIAGVIHHAIRARSEK